MQVGIMQPYFFPYIGYFQLINLTDKWIIFDDVQYIKRGWINRNRILKPDKNDWQYIIVPIENHNRKTKIKDIKIKNDLEWKDRIIRQLEHYKKDAQYFEKTIELVQKCLDIETDSMTLLNVNVLKTVCDYLDINFDYGISSQMNFDYSEVNDPDDWALTISKQLNADEYINPIGGLEFFDKNKYIKNNIEIKFLETQSIKYSQKNEEFIPKLSIIDILMYNSKNEIKEMLKEYELI